MFDDCVFVPSNHQYIRIMRADILYVKAEGSYVEIVTRQGRHSASVHLSLFAEQLADDSFVRVSRQYLVNVCHVHRINGTTLHIDKHEIPMGKATRQKLLLLLPVIWTKPTHGPLPEDNASPPEN